MEPILYVLAIMGCGDGQSRCEQVRVEPARYSSVVACRAAAPGALMRSTDLSYPVVVSECRTTQQVAAVATPTQTASR
ncbi:MULTISPECIES: hypothetical protein [Sphingomonas]|uniref:Uncharacterized protein n=2 Tax=Sphingomonas TaxID=13687 RepID=A0A7W9BSM0_9SPHN|nr:hypothetical protein [Sphingomonas prati]MBB5728858.1 hypothetical protein [Sphingomonas prati]GGE87006.1 hypothetical protein GCM10011404_19720 [Sphingomonas prati]